MPLNPPLSFCEWNKKQMFCNEAEIAPPPAAGAALPTVRYWDRVYASSLFELRLSLPQENKTTTTTTQPEVESESCVFLFELAMRNQKHSNTHKLNPVG